MFRKLCLCLAFPTAACSEDPRSIRLSDVDLSDMAALQELRERLTPSDQVALVNYAVLHSPSSRRYCGHPLIKSDGTQPLTIGDAIALSRLRQAQDASIARRPESPKSEAELVRMKWTDLVSRRDLVTDRLNALRIRARTRADRQSEGHLLKDQLKILNSQLAALEPRLLQP